MAADAIQDQEKREALERVLASKTFARSQRLRAFLRYICEAEVAGRAQEINEYALGVSVLGRRADYSPAEDSSVRSTAYELRSKLRSYYEAEASADPLQIEIEKGAYVPRFARRETIPVGDQPVAAIAVAEQDRPSDRRLIPVLVVAALVLVVGAVFLGMRARKPVGTLSRMGPLATPAMEALWKPFVDGGAPLLVSFETRLFFFAPTTGLVVRDYLVNQSAEAAASKPLQTFKERMGAPDLQERLDYADFGAVRAAFLLGHLLGADAGIKDSNSLGMQDFWNSNIVFVGKPTLNPTIRASLEGKDFVASEYGTAIHNLHPLPGEPDLYQLAATHGAGEKYGLVTVLPGPQPGRRIMILSGTASEVLWALAEAVTSPTRVQEIVSHLIGPSGECPPAFQVVIAATFESNVPVKIRYVTHRVSQTP